MEVCRHHAFSVTDHQIITEAGYYSFAERGLMKELAKSGLYEVTHKESEEMKAWREEELRKKSADENSRKIAEKMLAKGYPLDEIVALTGLRKASVEKMRREVGK